MVSGDGRFHLAMSSLAPLEFGVAVIAAPFPGGDGHAHRVAGRSDAHVLAGTTPGDGADIGVCMTVGGQDRLLSRLDLVDRVGNFEVKLIGREMQTLGMAAAFEDLTAIGSLAFEHRRGIVQRVGQNMHVRIPPWLQFAIHPDHSVAIVIASHGPASICKSCVNSSASDIFLRKIRESLPVEAWNVNKADIKSGKSK